MFAAERELRPHLYLLAVFVTDDEVTLVEAGPRVLHSYPEDLSRIEVWCEGRSFGAAVPFVLGRHVHRAVPQAVPPSPEPTGVDYLGLVEEQHDADTLGRLTYRDLVRDEEDPS